jgi:negative regulator of sigma E activity
VPRDPRQIQLEIDAARESLAATLDQLAYRSSPQRLKAQGQAAVVRFLQSPAGKAAMGAVGLLATIVVVNAVRGRTRSRSRAVGRKH